MSNSSSDGAKNKDTEKDDQCGDDGFFGPFRWRVFVIGLLVIIFAILQVPLISYELGCSVYDTHLTAFEFIVSGLLCIMIGAILAIVINFFNCNLSLHSV